jgi:hypothetical protein
MQASDPPERPSEGKSSSSPQSSPPRQKPSILANIGLSNFAAFRSQPQHLSPVPSPVRRKPLPANSPVVGRFAAAEFSNPSKVVGDKEDIQRSFSTNAQAPAVLSPPLSDEELFVPRNLDE